MLNEDQFMKGMAVLMAAYPAYKCTPETVDVYRVALRNLSPKEFEKAVWIHIKTLKWFPAVSELLEFSQAGRPTPIDAWNKLLAAAETGVLPEIDEATKRAMDSIGGWEVMQYTPRDELRFRLKEFREVYLEIQRGVSLPLIGEPQKALPEVEE